MLIDHLRKNQKFTPSYPTSAPQIGGLGVLQPGVQIDLNREGPENLTQELIDAFRNETLTMYLYGTIFTKTCLNVHIVLSFV